jgi:type VI secretion system protein ImpK
MPAPAEALPTTAPLEQLLGDGFLLLAHLRDLPPGTPLAEDPARLPQRVDAWLAAFERRALDAGHAPDQVQDAKYAFCALMDEAVLAADLPLRAAWEPEPLQLRHFGEHLAGEGFFRRLEALRRDPAAPALGVYHACLLQGFQGRYRLEGTEQLHYLTLRLGHELAHVRGGPAPFAPRWRPAPPGPGRHRRRPSLGTLGAALGVAALALFLAYALLLRAQASALAAPPELARTAPSGRSC